MGWRASMPHRMHKRGRRRDGFFGLLLEVGMGADHQRLLQQLLWKRLQPVVPLWGLVRVRKWLRLASSKRVLLLLLRGLLLSGSSRLLARCDFCMHSYFGALQLHLQAAAEVCNLLCYSDLRSCRAL